MKRSVLLLLAGPGMAMLARAQVNAYAEVTAIVGTTLTVANASETYDTFEDGEQAILMQMQEDVVGPYLSNNGTFGSLNAISSAGLWEVVTIASHTESLGLPVSVVTSGPLINIFHFGVKHRVQLISFPQLGSPDFNTTAPITAVPWNGITGGVVALQVAGTLNLGHDIRADNDGFRGGTTSVNYTSSCITTTYTTSSTNYAQKGEGIQRFSSTLYQYARGRFVNGGGGGNPRNAGGAGGGNFTAGGYGGGGYGCSSGGYNGRELANFFYWNRFFMGGGGGGGQQNNSIGGAGGSGGGIVILKANTLATAGSCATLYISANGADGGDSIGLVPDGAGGGGAGGSVYLEVLNFSISPTCGVTCQANGGEGGMVVNTNPAPGNWVDTGGGGGGGGQGAVMCNGAAAGVSAGTAVGSGGVHQPNGAQASNGLGLPDAGVFGFGGTAQLPIELLYFTGRPVAAEVWLDWATASETGNALFRVLRSADTQQWNVIAELPGAGDSQQVTYYSAKDAAPLGGTSFYRLEQVDSDGSNSFSAVVAVERDAIDGAVVYPLPADNMLHVHMSGEGSVEMLMLDGLGRAVRRFTFATQLQQLAVGDLPNGVYQLLLTSADGQVERLPIVIQH